MRKKTTFVYKKELALKNPNLELLSDYTGNHNKVKVMCKECNYIFNSDAASLLQGHGCKQCGIKNMKQKQRKSHEEFINELTFINPDIEVIDKYINSTTKIKVKCKICNHEYMSTPTNLLRGFKCIECFKKSQHKIHDDFVKELKNINNKVKVIGQYKNNHSKIKCKCLECNYEWEQFANTLLQRNNCPKCSRKYSHGEDRILEVLDLLGVTYIKQKTFDGLFGDSGKLLRYDFFIEKFNLIIEYNGQQHYKSINIFGGEKSFKLTKKYDKRKKDYANNNNIKLLIIPYWDYDNIEKILSKKLHINNFKSA